MSVNTVERLGIHKAYYYYCLSVIKITYTYDTNRVVKMLVKHGAFDLNAFDIALRHRYE